MFGKSDPYVNVCEFNGNVYGGNKDGGRRGRTKTIQNNLSPVWGETFPFIIGREVNEFVMKIFDDDIGRDDLMGKVRCVIDTPTKDMTVNLKKGSFHFSYKCMKLNDIAASVPALPKGGAPPAAAEGVDFTTPFDRLLVATMHSAKGLKDADFMGKSDPYVKVLFDAETGPQGCGKTSTIDNTLEPVWNEVFGFLLSSGVGRATLKVYDEDKLSSDDVIGKVDVLIRDPFQAAEVALQPKGTITVSLAFAPLPFLFGFDPEAARQEALAAAGGEAKAAEAAPPPPAPPAAPAAPAAAVAAGGGGGILAQALCAPPVYVAPPWPVAVAVAVPVVVAAPDPVVDYDKVIDRYFYLVDSDRSGNITMQELTSMLVQFLQSGLKPLIMEADRLARAKAAGIQDDGDNEMSMDEFRAFVKAGKEDGVSIEDDTKLLEADVDKMLQLKEGDPATAALILEAGQRIAAQRLQAGQS